jgi:putative transposase
MAMAGRLVEVSRMGTLERSYKYRLYPTSEQEATLSRWQSVLHEMQQWAIKQRRWADISSRIGEPQVFEGYAQVKGKSISLWFERNRKDKSDPGKWMWQERDTTLRFPDAELCPDKEQKNFLPTAYSQSAEITTLLEQRPHWREADIPRATVTEMLNRVEKGWKKARSESFKRACTWTTAMQKQREAQEKGKDEKGPSSKSRTQARARWANRASDIGLTFFYQYEAGGCKIEQADKRHANILLSRIANRQRQHRLGALRVRYHREIPADAEIRTATITRKADGWYISLACIAPAAEPLPPTGQTVGVDLNCYHKGDDQDIVALSNGRIYSVPDHVKKSRQKLDHLQKMVSNRKTRGSAKCADPNSNRTRKRRQQIAKLYQRITRQRDHELHYVARRIVDMADGSKFENIDWSNLRHQGTPREQGDNRRGGRKANKGRNRAMGSASPGKLRRLTQEKSDAGGRICGVVSAHGTSKMCSACGTMLDELSGDEREWTCPRCGTHHHRDVNAARNILAKEYIDPPEHEQEANYNARRATQKTLNPSASGDLPGEGLSGSVNSEPTARQSTAASAAESNAPIPNEEFASGEVQGEIPGVARLDAQALQRTMQRVPENQKCKPPEALEPQEE